MCLACKLLLSHTCIVAEVDNAFCHVKFLFESVISFFELVIFEIFCQQVIKISCLHWYIYKNLSQLFKPEAKFLEKFNCSQCFCPQFRGE